MRAAYFIFLFSMLVEAQSLSGQCLDRDSLLSQINLLPHKKSLTINGELNVLLGYDSIMKSCPERNDSVYAYLQIRIAIMYYLQTDYMQGIQHLNQAVVIAKKNLNSPLTSKDYLIRSYYFLSIFYDSLKLDREQNEAIDSTIAFEMKYDSIYHYSCFLLYNNVKELFVRGDYNLCIEHAGLGEALTHKSYPYDDRSDYITDFIEYKTRAMLLLGRYSEAEQFLVEKEAEFLRSGNKSYIVKIYRLYGYLKRDKGENQKAISYFLKANENDQYTKEKSVLGEVLTQAGLIYSEKFHDPRPAIQYYKRALRAARNFNTFYIYGYMANAYVMLGNFDSANYFFQKAFDKIKPGLTEEGLAANAGDYIDMGSAEQILRLLLDKGDSFLDRYQRENKIDHLHQALRIYRATDQLINYIKGTQFSVESKLYWRNYASRLYSHAIESCYLSGDEAEAFYFFEKTRAVLLNDQLNEQSLLSRDDLLKLAHLKSKILITGRSLNNTEPSSKQYTEIERALFTYKQELIRLDESIKKQSVVYYQRSLDTVSVSIQDVQKKILQGGGSFVGIFSGENYLYSLVITATSINLLRTNKQSFDSVRNIFNSLISKPDLLNSRFPLYVNASSTLFKMVFQNITIPSGRMIISPDGQYFPFEALVTGKTGETVNYFITDHTVSYTYSARFLLNNFYSNSSSSGKSFMGIAPISYPSAFSLASLRGSGHSLETISGNFGGAVNMISSEATRNNFLKQFYQYEIIQLYTHASDSSKNNEPVIYFSDSALYLSDLIGENKPLTRLIVLSACKTGVGKDYKGEGVFSFNRGFAALGIPSSITNLWTVDDESTYEITESFYKYVAQGLALDEALQRAKVNFINTSSKDKKLPYYWAAAVLVGSTESIQVTHSTSWTYYVAIIAVPVFFLVAFMFLRRRKFFGSIPGKMKTA